MDNLSDSNRVAAATYIYSKTDYNEISASTISF